MEKQIDEQNYAGFWRRFVAQMIDCILFWIILKILTYGDVELLLNYDSSQLSILVVVLEWIAPVVAVILFWYFASATPGKMVLGLKIVDATTGDKPTKWQLIGRFLGYFVSLFLGFGFVAIGITSRKQGFHDNLANTVVVWNER